MRQIVAYFGTLGARIVLLLTIGMSISAFGALLIAQHAQAHMFERLRLQNVVASAVDVAHRIDRDPPVYTRMLASDQILGARLLGSTEPIPSSDRVLSAMLRERLGNDAVGTEIPEETCFPSLRFRQGLLADIHEPRPVCWLIRYSDHARMTRTLAVGLPRFVIPPRLTLDPLYLVLLVSASALLGILTAHIATAPLRRLTKAARAFSISSDPEPILEAGPREVKTALATFNLMQSRVTKGLRERTQILAAISHDLQTPLTRLRLRLEQVPDEALRGKLIADLTSMNKLVREGLDLARSSESREPWQIVDIDSLLGSLAEDAAEFGADVRYVSSCGVSARTKPDALIRCLTNLIDNAVKYGGKAELSCVRATGILEIHVRDNGPGIPEDALERVFEPFVRGDENRSRARGGTGIGLTIARAQASLFGGMVTLTNRASGGMDATISVST